MVDSVETKKSCEKPKVKPEISETFNWSKEERQKLNESVLVENVRKKLIEKYPEQKCFFETTVIKVMQLGDNIKEYKEVISIINTNIFLLYSIDGKLLSYLDQNGNTMFDISTFNFDDDFANLLSKKNFNKYIKKNDKGNLELYFEGKIYSEGSREFNSYIFGFYLGLGRYLK